MNIADLFLRRYEPLRAAMATLVPCPEQEWRARPHGLNPPTWLVWHMARAEDSGLNRLVFDRPQVLDDAEQRWPERLRVPLRHHGTTMTAAEVDDLNARVDLPALWAYSEAVAARTRALVRALQPALLDAAVDPTHLRRVLFDEGMLRPEYDWGEPPPYSGAAKGVLLFHFGLTHNFGHWYELLTVHSLLGSPRQLHAA
jgi:hypothetical protein